VDPTRSLDLAWRPVATFFHQPPCLATRDHPGADVRIEVDRSASGTDVLSR